MGDCLRRMTPVPESGEFGYLFPESVISRTADRKKEGIALGMERHL